LRSIG